MHNCELFGKLQAVRAAETFKSSHRPDGKNADALALIHACTTVTDASMNYSLYVPQRPRKFPSPRWDFHMFCALCLQGGGVLVNSGTVSFSSCAITGNRAYSVRAHAQKFPSPRWEKCSRACFDSRLHNCGRRSGELQWVRAAKTFCEFPIAPMGNC